jgi:shikimate kinase
MSARRQIVLIGLPGAGKTTVGEMLAERLMCPFVDVDTIITRKMQMPVTRVFAEFGEPKFRAVEREAVLEALGGEPSVIVPGGGWSAQPGHLADVGAAGFIIYLKCMATTAAKRVQGGDTRPVMAGDDPYARMRVLLQEREAYYAQADAEVKTDTRTAPQVTEEVLGLVRARAGW